MNKKLETITFDKGAANFILNALGKTIGKDGYIIEKNNPDQMVITPSGEEIKYTDFAGVKPGSEVFIKSDIVSLVTLASDLI
jgi:hypothetical protein